MMRFLKPSTAIASIFAKTKGAILLSLLLIYPLFGRASFQQQPRETNWFIAGSSGVAFLTREISNGFRFLPNEFRHQPGFCFDLSLGRTLGNRWETIFRLGAYTLFGESNLPVFSASGYQTSFPELLHQEPVEYITQSSSGTFILRFLLNENPRIQNNSLNLNPFIEAGVGINSFASELRYKTMPSGQESPLIFRKRNGEQNIGVAQIITGLGTKIGGYGEWNAIILLNAEWVNYDTLDAVHNFSDGERNNAKGIVTRLTAGISIPIRRNIKNDNNLPFRW